MAVNCVDKFNNTNTVIREIVPDTPYSGLISSAFTGQYFEFTLHSNQTIFFNLKINPNTNAAINVEFTLYKKDSNGVFTDLGTSISTLGNNSFTYSGSEEHYYICVTSDFSVDIILEAQFTVFEPVAILSADSYHGHYVDPFDFAKPIAFCDSPVFFELLSGELPKGLTFTSSGIIEGYPEELDCTSNTETPSFSLHTTENEVVKPVSVDYPITIRAALVDDTDTFTDREFKICVVNNWTTDKDWFVSFESVWEQDVEVIEGQESWRPVIVDEYKEIPLLANRVTLTRVFFSRPR